MIRSDPSTDENVFIKNLLIFVEIKSCLWYNIKCGEVVVKTTKEKIKNKKVLKMC
jgi:hypothetical protein